MLVSLWEIDDRSTSELMGCFYEGMCKFGMLSSNALRWAQLEMIKKNYTPYHWAPFQLIGY